MENKKSFILFQEYRENLSLLSQSDKGDLLDAIFAFNDGEEVKLSPIVAMAFSFIKADLIRNSGEWQKTKKERSNSGRLGNIKRWHQDLYSQIISKEISLEEAENIAKHRKTSHSDNSESLKSQEVANIAANVNVNGNVKEDIDLTSTSKPTTTIKSSSLKNGGVGGKEKKLTLEIPDFIDAELWNDFVKKRNSSQKTKLTERAASLILKDLINFENKKPGNANLALENTIKQGWQGVFEPKHNQTSGFKSRTQHNFDTLQEFVRNTEMRGQANEQ